MSEFRDRDGVRERREKKIKREYLCVSERENTCTKSPLIQLQGFLMRGTKKNTLNQIKEQQVINANVFGVKAFETRRQSYLRNLVTKRVSIKLVLKFLTMSCFNLD